VGLLYALRKEAKPDLGLMVDGEGLTF